MMDCDLLIQNGLLLTMNGPDGGLIEKGFVAVTGTTIASLGPSSALPRDIKARSVLDAAGKLIMPGLVNTHIHAAMTLFRGLADDLPLMAWLQEHIFPAEAKFVSPEMVYWCSKLAAAEMLLSGTTTVADGYFLEDSAARAFQEAGLRAVAAQGIIDFPAPGVPDPAGNIDAAADFLENWRDKNDRITPAVFCHSPYTCGAETIRRGKELADLFHAPFFIHAAETRQEVEQIRNSYGISPILHLHSLGILDEKTVLVHCVHLQQEELSLIAACGSRIAHCPESNMKMASGCAPLPQLLKQGITVGLGTDGCASNNDLDLFGEMNCCAKLHKLVSDDPTVVSARQVLRLATVDGARVLGLDRSIGTLAVGRKADIICIDCNQPHLTPLYNQDLLVYSARGADVTDVLVDGQRVVENRRIRTIDLEETLSRVKRMSEAVKNTE
jgi:5-methylthioadenosine/S-adenosylhomocysteine deaminase